jgi:hypothetical protein
MKERNLFSAIFGVVESVTKSELTNIARTLIINYYQGSEQPTCALKARETVLRYAQCRVLPRLADIRQKDRSRLDRLEHLVLKMEYEAALLDGSWPPASDPALLDGSWPPASDPAQPPSAVPESSSFAEALPVPPGGRINPKPDKAIRAGKPAAARRKTPRQPAKRTVKKKAPRSRR